MNFQKILIPLAIVGAAVLAYRAYSWPGIAVVVTFLVFGFRQRGNMRADQVERTLLEDDVAFLDLGATGADRLDFPTLQHPAGFKALFDEVIEKCFLVFSNAHRAILSQ